ncbi:hypothetical protein HAX54_026779 [Datura stramonium]|uniref:Cupin type-1 domain-containing protein n=1 Tax=Datura stramonium TaxID=4076 RepID=A0ABS8V1Q8_DATST|nr:hypothetical protein [Datura stramonium]
MDMSASKGISECTDDPSLVSERSLRDIRAKRRRTSAGSRPDGATSDERQGEQGRDVCGPAASTEAAGQNGFEFVVWRTSSEPMNSQLAGYTSVIRAMPVEVLTNAFQISPNEAQRLKMNRGGEFPPSPQSTNAFQISPNEAQRLKMNRGGESFLLSPQRRSY